MRRAMAVLLAIVALMAMLFLPAGHLGWIAGWVFLGSYLFAGLGTWCFLKATDQGLLAERQTVHQGTKAWDRVLANLFGLGALPATLVVAGLDERYTWSPRLPWGWRALALALALLAYALVVWAMAANTFFGSYVRIQHERGHRAVSGGPYRYVRHPGYVGMALALPALAIWLDSLWALIPAGVGTGLIVLRTALEDRTLQRELAGYAEYAERTRYRLIPGLW